MECYQPLTLDLICTRCHRIYRRTLALPIDEKGRSAGWDQGFTFSCLVCNAGKFTPLQHVKSTDARAEKVRKLARAANESGVALLETVAWDAHVREEDTRKILTEADIEFSEGDDE